MLMWSESTTDGHLTMLGSRKDLQTVVREICPDITRAVAQITRLEYFLARIFETNHFVQICICFASFADLIC